FGYEAAECETGARGREGPCAASSFFMAEREGFEPSVRLCRTHTFQACSFDRSDTSPVSLELYLFSGRSWAEREGIFGILCAARSCCARGPAVRAGAPAARIRVKPVRAAPVPPLCRAPSRPPPPRDGIGGSLRPAVPAAYFPATLAT